MAIIVAVRSGNWSDTSPVTGPWPGESTPTTKPGVGDTVQAGDCVVEIDEDVHVAMLEATGSGYFAVSNVYPAPQRPNITAAIVNAAIVNNETENGTLQINGGTIGDITGDLTAGNVNGAWAVYNGGGTIGDIDGSLICGATGQFPIFSPFRLVADPANAIVVTTPSGNPWTLSNDYPAPADVRSGVEYDRGTQTGEMAAGGSIVIGGGGIRIS